MTGLAASRVAHSIGRAIAPRKPTRVSEWAAANRILSDKASSEPGPWRNSRNPLLVEPMDCFSARSPVRECVCKFCIQFGKSELENNILGYTMCEVGGPIMVCLPGQVSLDKFVDQKLNPLLDETPAVRRTLVSLASRDAANRRTFKDFAGGQLYLEHAGNPVRLKSTSVRTLLVDEFSSFASACRSGDDPEQLLDGRNTAYPTTYKRLKVGTPEIKGVCRIDVAYERSDQRRWYVPCPECGHEQPLEWAGLQYVPDGSACWYMCRDCHCVIEEHHKDAMIDAGRWVAENPSAEVRGYHANALYHKMGRGPRWLELVREWLAAQNDPAKLKTFVNDRLAEAWEDPAMRAVKHNLIADRAEPLPLRPVPDWILAVTAGIDTQDNRLAVQIVGWGRGFVCWPIDYVELPGDPAEDAVWDALVDLLRRPIERAAGGFLRVEASLQDGAGHRTEAVKAFARRAAQQQLLRRHVVGFGAKANNAPVLSKGSMVDVNYRGQYDKRGIKIYHVGTVGAKHLLYGRLSADADKAPEQRQVRFSDELEPSYFSGLVSETYNPAKNRFEHRRGGARNEPLDTWVYAFAAAHHPELRLHRATKADWDAREVRLLASAGPPVASAKDSRETLPEAPAHSKSAGAPAARPAPVRPGFRRNW
jgi:phage terminase large subunit GpA-like protein